MNRCHRDFLILSLLVLCLVAAAVPAAAQTVFWAPPSVQADGAGNFSFTAGVATGDDGCVGIWGWHYEGLDNIETDLWVDTFCIDPQPIGAGEFIGFAVSGSLVDPARPGTILSESGCCNILFDGVVTVVLAPTVANEDVGWGTLKARYR